MSVIRDPQREPLVVRVAPDVAGIDSVFDYTVPDSLRHRIRPGTKVRVPLHGRSVAGWVLEVDVTPPEGVKLREISRVSSDGPDEEILSLAEWAAWRWAGRRTAFLSTASPPRNVTLPHRPTESRFVDDSVASRPSDRQSGVETQFVDDRVASRPSDRQSGGGPNAAAVRILRWPPAQDPYPIVQETVAHGPALILTPSQRGAERLSARLRGDGVRVALYPEQWAEAASGATVVGTLSAAWATIPGLTSILVLDAHDEALRAEGAPTWDAIALLRERAQRRNIPLTLLSGTPRLEHLEVGRLETVDRAQERAGWATMVVIDQRNADPHSGLYSEALVRALRSDDRVLCVLNRKGRAALLVCTNCGETAHCERCDGRLAADTDDGLHCRRCQHDQPSVCAACGGLRFKQLRAGVTKVREEMEHLAGRPVGEVTSATDGLPDAPVLVGTEALLHRAGRADVVVFLDFDQELLSPQVRANENALILLARASRLTRGRAGRVLVQTRQPDHLVLDAAVHSDPGRLLPVEEARRKELQWPPFGALATVGGPNAPALVATAPLGIEVLGPEDHRFLLRAPTVPLLCDGLGQMKRPPGRLGLRVDPYRF